MKTINSVAAALLLAGCGGAINPAIPAASSSSQAAVSQPDAGVKVFTANRDGASVLGFSNKATGNAAPAVTISGSKTTLSQPDALALDSKGNIFAANDGANQVVVFGPGSNGNVKPKRTIGGTKSQLGPTEGIFVDKAGNLWVANYSGAAVTEYAAGAHGNVAPIDTISGNKTGLSEPFGMAMDKQTGSLWRMETAATYSALRPVRAAMRLRSSTSAEATPAWRNRSPSR